MWPVNQDVRRSPVGLTAKQAECLTAIRDITKAQGYPPNMTELAAYLNVVPSTAQLHVGNLRKKGYLARGENGKHRTARLTDKARALFREG